MKWNKNDCTVIVKKLYILHFIEKQIVNTTSMKVITNHFRSMKKMRNLRKERQLSLRSWMKTLTCQKMFLKKKRPDSSMKPADEDLDLLMLKSLIGTPIQSWKSFISQLIGWLFLQALMPHKKVLNYILRLQKVLLSIYFKYSIDFMNIWMSSLYLKATDHLYSRVGDLCQGSDDLWLLRCLCCHWSSWDLHAGVWSKV